MAKGLANFFQNSDVVSKNVSSSKPRTLWFWVKESGGIASVDLIF